MKIEELDIEKLTEVQKIDLIHRLEESLQWDSLGVDDDEDEAIAEAERRLEDINNGTLGTVPAKEVFKNLGEVTSSFSTKASEKRTGLFYIFKKKESTMEMYLRKSFSAWFPGWKTIHESFQKLRPTSGKPCSNASATTFTLP